MPLWSAAKTQCCRTPVMSFISKFQLSLYSLCRILSAYVCSFAYISTLNVWELICLAQSDLILHVRNVFLLHSQLVREIPVSFLFELGISPLNSTQSITCCVRKDNFGKCLFWELSFCVKTGPNRSLLFSLLWPKLTFTSHVLLV